MEPGDHTIDKYSIMKIRDIILETAVESRELQTISKKIADHIVERDGEPQRFTAKDIGVSGRESSIATTLLRLVFSVVSKPGIDEIAQYNHNTNTIEINWPRVVEDAEDQNTTPQNELAKTLVHELQHAVDGTKSKGQALMKTPATKSGDTEDQEFEEYLKLPHEVNARFAEALDDISEQLPYIREVGQLPEIINDAFAKREINRVFPGRAEDPRYRRLLSRAYQYYAYTLKNDEEPSDQQAKQFILKK